MHATDRMHPDAKARKKMLAEFLRQANKSTPRNNDASRSAEASMGIKATQAIEKP